MEGWWLGRLQAISSPCARAAAATSACARPLLRTRSQRRAARRRRLPPGCGSPGATKTFELRMGSAEGRTVAAGSKGKSAPACPRACQRPEPPLRIRASPRRCTRSPRGDPSRCRAQARPRRSSEQFLSCCRACGSPHYHQYFSPSVTETCVARTRPVAAGRASAGRLGGRRGRVPLRFLPQAVSTAIWSWISTTSPASGGGSRCAVAGAAGTECTLLQPRPAARNEPPLSAHAASARCAGARQSACTRAALTHLCWGRAGAGG